MIRARQGGKCGDDAERLVLDVSGPVCRRNAFLRLSRQPPGHRRRRFRDCASGLRSFAAGAGFCVDGRERRDFPRATRADLPVWNVDPVDRLLLSARHLYRRIGLPANDRPLRQFGRRALDPGISRRTLPVRRNQAFGCRLFADSAVLSGKPARIRTRHVRNDARTPADMGARDHYAGITRLYHSRRSPRRHPDRRGAGSRRMACRAC